MLFNFLVMGKLPIITPPLLPILAVFNEAVVEVVVEVMVEQLQGTLMAIGGSRAKVNKAAKSNLHRTWPVSLTTKLDPVSSRDIGIGAR